VTTWSDEPPAGAASDSTAPAGISDQDRAAQRKQWAPLQASHGRGQRGGPYRRQVAQGTLRTLRARAGMIRKEPPPDGDDAA
jgi:hypothetical protein